ncbi:MAG: glycosyltransferase family protein [Candidatus Asgardarchaeia archaeon]
MARILFSVSPIGLGHASRSIAIANELRKKGHEITFITGNISPPKFISAYGYSVKDIIKYPEFYVDKEGILKNTTLWMIKYILAYKRNKKEIIKSVNLSDFDLLISDEEFALASVAFQNSLPLVVISDIIGSQFARNPLAKYIEKRTNEWFYNFFREAPLSIIPEFEGPIEGKGVHYIGPIARTTNKTRDEIRSVWNFDDKKIILLTSSGSGIGSFLFRRAIDVFDKVQNMLKDQVELVVASPMYSNNSSNTNSRRNIRFLGFVRD